MRNMAVAIDHHHGFKPFSRSRRCRLQSFTHLDYYILELGQSNLAHSLQQAFDVENIHRSFSTPCLSLATRVEEENDTNPRIDIVGGRGAPRVRALVVEVAIAMASGIDPMPVPTGLGGAYFIRSKNGDNVAVVKPIDEEPLAFNNPKGFGGLMLGQPGVKRSVRVGETGIRELAAYLLDHGGFAGVPPTAVVKISHVAFHVNDSNGISAPPYKIASLQSFVDHDFDAGDLGPSSFSVDSVHRIGIFDLRLLNLDRHAGNMLVKKQDQSDNYRVGAAELVPIDHGLCLPEWLDDPYFEWLHWPQASVPFSDFEIEYICNLDPFKDADILRTEVPNMRESSIRVMIICTIFLKRAAIAGLCLAEIGQMMTREFSAGEESLSALEDLCAEAKARGVTTPNDETGSSDENEEIEIFQFDSDNCYTSSEILDLPAFLQSPVEIGKPPKIPRFSTATVTSGFHDAGLSPSCERNGYNSDDCHTTITKENGGNSGGGDDRKVGVLTRSMSCSVENYYHESGGISIGDMNEGEWEMFLESFEKLLPEVFEGTKNTGLKQRLGTSCKF